MANNLKFQHARSIFFVLLLSALFKTSGYGQSFTPVEYNFPSNPGKYSFGSEPISGTLISSASNGYGTWAVDDEGHWYLLSDSLATENTSSTNPVASGVIEKGDIEITEIQSLKVKVVANLAGNVRFVAPTTNYDGFIVQGFNDDRAIQPAHRNIDISFAGLPNALNSRKVTKQPIVVYPTVPIQDGGNNDVIYIGDVASRGLDYKDAFDVAIDSNFLYIVWQCGATDSLSKVNVTIVKLSDGTVINNTFPKRLGLSCIMPTIACNVRNVTPAAFFSAMIESNEVTPANNRVIFSEFNGTNLTNAQTLTPFAPPTFIDPRVTNPNGPVTNMQFRFPKHARVVVGSTRITTSTSQSSMAIYVIGNGPGEGLPDGGISSLVGDDLLLWYKGDARLRYVDGALIDVHPLPLGLNTAFQVVNVHLRAFSNPYDGKHGMFIDEVHCMYQLKDDRPGVSNFMKNPLLICIGANNGSLQHPFPATTFPLSSSTDTRVLLSKELNPSLVSLPSPIFFPTINHADYIGSVNQKGIHVYWSGFEDVSTRKIYYERDYRFLDEPIEENTLLTYENTIADGTTHLSTTIGAKLMPGRIMTLWTDPNFDNGALYTSSSTQIGWQNARLKFVGTNVRLDIGETTIPVCNSGGDGPPNYYACSVTWAKLVMLPNTEIRFQDECTRTNNQILSINPGSTFEFFGVPSNNPQTSFDGESNFFGAGTINLKGEGNVGPLGPNEAWGSPMFSAPARLNIHGGATFVLPNAALLTSNKSIIECFFESNVTGVNSFASGQFKCHGTVEMTLGYFIGHHDPLTAPTGMDFATILNVVSPMPITNPLVADICTLATEQWHSQGVQYSNSPDNGRAKLLFNGTNATENFRGVTFKKGYMKAVELDIQDPVHDVEVDEVIFSKTKEFALIIKRNLSRNHGKITVKRNKFTFTAPDVDGIYIDGFGTRSSTEFDVIIDNNALTSSTAPILYTTRAISVYNTDAKVTNNSISGAGFHKGINIDASSIINGTTSFICSNTISDCITAGIHTYNWKGYAFLNTVSACGIGHLHDGNKEGHIHFSIYENCLGPGLKLVTNQSILLNSLSDPNYGIKGHNTIRHNNQNQNSAQIEITSSDGKVRLGSGSVNDAKGENNVIANNTGDPATDLFGKGTLGNITAKIYMPNDVNYWAEGTGNGTVVQLASAASRFSNVGFDVSIDAQSLTYLTPPSGFECGEGIVPTIAYNPNDMMLDLPFDRCYELEQKGKVYSHNFQPKKAYDTLRYLIENCPYFEDVSYSFSEITSSVYDLVVNHQETSYNYREWLKSVLYLNPDSVYYCNDALEIAGSYMLEYENGIVNGDEAATVCRFLLDSAQCSYMRNQILSMQDNIARHYQYRKWKDTVTDSIATPYSPGYTTLEALDLTILRGFKNAVNADLTKPLQRNPISESIVIPNPIKDEMELRYKLTEGVLVKVEVFDALGKQMYSVAQGYKPKGDNLLRFDTRAWSSGSYYIRMTTLGGEVKTVKVVKE